MNKEVEKKLLQEIAKLQKEMRELKGEDSSIPIYSFSKIKNSDLKNIVDIKLNINESKFDYIFNNDIIISDETTLFLETLIAKIKPLIKYYREEDLKIHFLAHLFGKINFTSYKNRFRDFYNAKLVYKNDKFILQGEADFMLASGLVDSEKPYFFIQEFKKEQSNSYPEPQLLAELISAVELNNESVMEGAYIVGAIWNFVILEKVGKDSYEYYVSYNFDSTKIDDLKNIYKNLVFIKNKIIKKIQNTSKE